MIKKFSLKKDGEKYIQKNFRVKEFACKDGTDEIIIDTDLIDILQVIRNKIEEPIKIVSGYRTIDYNNKCSGTKNSYHLKGEAVDITARHISIYKLALYAASFGIKGIGIYQKDNFIHIDLRKDFYFWEQ